MRGIVPAVDRLWALALILALAWLPRASQRMFWQEIEPGYWERSVLPQMGLATYYAPGMMEYVQNYRVARGQLPACDDCVGAVALLRAGDIGRKVWLQPPGGELAGPFLVIDCAQVPDVQPLLDRNWVVDVSYELGKTWGMTAPLDGVIVWADPAEGNAPGPPPQPTQFYIDPEDVVITAPTAAVVVPTLVLPTRLPVPRNVPPTAAPAQPVPLTPVITTPTPPGGAPPGDARRETASSPTPAPPTGAEPVASPTSALRVAFGRPGSGLLGLPTPGANQVLAVPVASPASYLAATPGPLPTSTILSERMTKRPAPTGPVEKPNLLRQVWRTLLDLLTPE